MEETPKKRKAFVVMGGGIVDETTPCKWVEGRIKFVIDNICNQDYVVFSSSFTLNKSPLIINNKVISEAAVSYNFYVNQVGKINNLLCENFSHDSVGSVYFSSLIVESLGITEVVFVTSDFHENRVKIIVNKVQEFFKIKISVIGIKYDKKLSINRNEDESILKFQDMFGFCNTREEFFLTLVSKHDNYNHKYSSTMYKNLKTY